MRIVLVLAAVALAACSSSAEEPRPVTTRGDHPEHITCDEADTACSVADLGLSEDCHGDAGTCRETASFHGTLTCCR